MPPQVSAPNCPGLDELRRYIQGEGVSENLESIDAHILSCSLCQQQLEQLGHASDFISHLISDAVQSPPMELPRSLERALEKIRNSQPAFEDLRNPPTMDSREPAQIRDYRILESIGEGGMGHVYRAVHVRLNRPVAIKVLRQDRVHSLEAVARFSREMQVIAQLEHPQIVRALDAGEQDGMHYLVMEFLSGVDVGQLSSRLGPLPIPDACQIIASVATALQYAHDRRILHRDVKPSNIFLTVDGDAKVLDLGLAQFSEFNCEPSLSRADQALGTLAYMAPEQLFRREEVTARADIFSLGVSFHQILTGQRPYERIGTAPLLAELSTTRPDVDTALQALIREMVSYASADRPATMQAVVERLKPYTVSADLTSLVLEYFRWDRKKSSDSIANSTQKSNPSHSLVQTTEATMSTQPSAISRGLETRTVTTRRNAWSREYGIAITILAIGLGTWLIAERFSTPETKETEIPSNDAALVELPPTTTGNLEITPVGEVPQQLLMEGAVIAINNETKESISLQNGENAIDAGSYSIVFDAPEEIDPLMDVQVAKGAARKLQLTTSLKNPFQFPSLPETIGAFASYHGTLWHIGWPKGKELPFNIRMQIIGNEASTDNTRWTWLKMETTIHHALGDCTETGFLLINADRWINENFMEISKGYIRASGNAIARLPAEILERSKANRRNVVDGELVVRFDQQRDTLKEFASSAVQEQRLSLHDFVALFFGDDQMAAAAEPIRKLRAELPRTGDRNAWIQSVPNSRGEVPCYVVSSRHREDSSDKVGYFMARNKREPFSFVRLEVNTPIMKALCVITGSGVGNVDASELSRVEKSIIEIPPENERNQYWDRATIPTESASTTLQGVIAIDTKPRQLIQTTVSTLGTETVDNVQCRWLEVEASSTLERGEDPYFEAARILVDDEQYRLLGKFEIKKGWIAYGDKETVFAVPYNRNLQEIAHQRLILMEDPKFQRFGVVDVLSMLFDADFLPPSQLSLLRKAIRSDRVGMSPICTPVDIVVGGAPAIPGELWTSPENSEFEYQIRKASQIPFNLVDVVLKRGSMAKISLEIKNHVWFNNATFPGVLGSDRLLAAHHAETQSRVEEASNVNWRVWTWQHEGRTFKAFAEYAGTTTWFGAVSDRSNVVVVLRNRRGDEIRVPSSALSDDDWNWARNGRIWVSMLPSHQDKQYLMVGESKDTISFQYRDTLNIYKKDLKELDAADQTWILALREARKIKDDLPGQPAKWMQFAPYIR